MPPPSRRIASIDWMRGFVMILMVIDHASMAYNANHLSSDSAALYTPGSPLPAFGFFTRWISHLCAPTFVFLAGTALAISVERKVAKGVDAWQIDKDILYRGAFIAILDPTLISLFSGRLTIQVLYAIGVAMMCMAFLRRLSTAWLLVIATGWLIGGEWITSFVWPPSEGWPTYVAALLISTYSSPELVIKYPLVPWLVMMILGWVFGRFVLLYREEKVNMSPLLASCLAGVAGLAIFGATRLIDGYGNLWLLRDDNSWIQWLHVSKYPPSLSFTALELGLMFLCLAGMMLLERRFGVRQNGPLLVFGQTAMFFYLVHRIVLEGSATWLGLRGVGDITTTYAVSLAIVIALYPACRGWRSYKASHPEARWTRYL